MPNTDNKVKTFSAMKTAERGSSATNIHLA
jgi:hypothetical protein